MHLGALFGIPLKSSTSWGPLWDSMGPSLGFHGSPACHGALFGIPLKSSTSWGPLGFHWSPACHGALFGIPLKSCMSWGPLELIQHFMGPSFRFHWSPACHGALFGFPFPADMLKKQGVWGITKQGQRSSCVWFNWKFRRNYLVNSFSWSGVQGCMVFTANWCAIGPGNLLEALEVLPWGGFWLPTGNLCVYTGVFLCVCVGGGGGGGFLFLLLCGFYSLCMRGENQASITLLCFVSCSCIFNSEKKYFSWFCVFAADLYTCTCKHEVYFLIVEGLCISHSYLCSMFIFCVVLLDFDCPEIYPKV